MQALAREIEQQQDAHALRVRMHEHIGPLGRDVWTAPAPFAQYIADRVLEAKRAKVRVIDRGMASGELARQRTVRIDMLFPRDFARVAVEIISCR